MDRPRVNTLCAAVVFQFDRAGPAAPRLHHHLSDFVLPDTPRLSVYARLPAAVVGDLYGQEMLAATWISRFAVAGGLIWILLWRQRSGSTKTN